MIESVFEVVTMTVAAGGIALAILIVVHFLPAVIAIIRGHHNVVAIILVNILFGWTFIGWGIALIWSFTSINKNC